MPRNYISFYLNGEKIELRDEKCFSTLSTFLRYQEFLTGTKVVCAEGDCGACTVLVADLREENPQFLSINSCITFMYLMDGKSIVTIEGLKQKEKLHPVQNAMANNYGAQCGYCTPGFVMAMTGLYQEELSVQKKSSEKKIKNNLTGNLCRCTGYQAIIDSAKKAELNPEFDLRSIYLTKEIVSSLQNSLQQEVLIKFDNL